MEEIKQDLCPKVTASWEGRIFGSKTTILWGKERLPEKLGTIQFALSPRARAFFQLNPQQTIKLYDAVQEAAALTGSELVIDAYCGTGTISLWLAF